MRCSRIPNAVAGYDRQLRDARARPVVVRQAIVSFAEPLLSSPRSSFGLPATWMTVRRSSFFDELVEELFASSTSAASATAPLVNTDSRTFDRY